MKFCLYCKQEKDDSAFYSYRPTKCKKCLSAAALEKYAANPDRFAAIRRKNYYKDLEATRLYRRTFAKNKRDSDPEAARVKERTYYRANPGAGSKKTCDYLKRNPHINAMRVAKYQRAAKQATPAWANDFFIEEIYDLAQRRTRSTGVLWTVDHLVPLQSKKVCGLHCEANLAVITKLANCQKKNSHWPGMWE